MVYLYIDRMEVLLDRHLDSLGSLSLLEMNSLKDHLELYKEHLIGNYLIQYSPLLV